MSLLGFDAIGRWALGQNPSSGAALAAVSGVYSISGQPAAISVAFPVAAGAYVVSGQAATEKVQFAAAAGSFVVTGYATTFGGGIAPASGAYLITGNAARAPVVMLAAGGSYALAPTDTPLIRTGFDYEFQQGGIGHFLYERARAKQLAAITRTIPPPIDRRSAPQFEPLARAYSAPLAPPIDLQAVQAQRMAAQAAAVQAATKRRRRDEEAILLLAS